GLKRRKAMIFNDCTEIIRPQKLCSALKFVEKTLVVDVKTERFRRRKKVRPVNKQRESSWPFLVFTQLQWSRPSNRAIGIHSISPEDHSTWQAAQYPLEYGEGMAPRCPTSADAITGSSTKISWQGLVLNWCSS